MSTLTISGSALATAITAANDLAGSMAGTVTSNAGWLILIATAGLLIVVVTTIMLHLARLGYSGNGISLPSSNIRLQETYMAEIERKAYKAGRSGEAAMDNIPLSAIDRLEHLRVESSHGGKEARKRYGEALLDHTPSTSDRSKWRAVDWDAEGVKQAKAHLEYHRSK